MSESPGPFINDRCDLRSERDSNSKQAKKGKSGSMTIRLDDLQGVYGSWIEREVWSGPRVKRKKKTKISRCIIDIQTYLQLGQWHGI